ncbi:alpha-N-arabinofuranosidase, partial [Thiopseudomonas sp. 4R-3cl]
GRPVLEDIYTFEDALLVGGLLITLLRYSNRVKIACLAQLVNVIGPIRVDNGEVWRQPTYFPFAQVANNSNGSIIDLKLNGPSYEMNNMTVPYVDGIGVISEVGNQLSVFLLNRNPQESYDLNIEIENLDHLSVEVFTEMQGYDLKQTNQNSESVIPVNRNKNEIKLNSKNFSVNLKPLSWNTIIFKK